MAVRRDGYLRFVGGLSTQRGVNAAATAVVATLADALDQLSAVRLDLGDADSAASIARAAIALRERLDGPDHPAVAREYMRLSVALRNGGHPDAAEPAIRHALDIQRRRHLPAEHPHLLETEHELGFVLLERGKYADAERLLRRVFEVRRRTEPGSGDYAARLRAGAAACARGRAGAEM